MRKPFNLWQPGGSLKITLYIKEVLIANWLEMATRYSLGSKIWKASQHQKYLQRNSQREERISDRLPASGEILSEIQSLENICPKSHIKSAETLGQKFCPTFGDASWEPLTELDTG